jgi:predicted HicB family RNase H-like nuclease
MAKKGAKKVKTIQAEPMVKPVRLVLTERDHVRLESMARRKGLSLASYARQALMERLTSDEAKEQGR